MTTKNEAEKIEVALSDRAPVRLTKADWPVIASASWFSGQYDFQAGEKAYCKVLRHADGRVVVYGRRHEGPGGRPVGYVGAHAGFLLSRRASSEEIARTIRRVVGVLGSTVSHLADEAIADLPAEDL